MRCNEEQVREWVANFPYNEIANALADLAADWLELHAENDRLRKRLENGMAVRDAFGGGLLQASDALARVEAERDSLRKRLADAESEIDYLRRIGKAYQETALDRAKEGK